MYTDEWNSKLSSHIYATKQNGWYNSPPSEPQEIESKVMLTMFREIFNRLELNDICIIVWPSGIICLSVDGCVTCNPDIHHYGNGRSRCTIRHKNGVLEVTDFKNQIINYQINLASEKCISQLIDILSPWKTN